ncbi:MAG: hypothetical protein AAGU11_18520 [Syntrophobacteraceae bacterium]
MIDLKRAALILFVINCVLTVFLQSGKPWPFDTLPGKIIYVVIYAGSIPLFAGLGVLAIKRNLSTFVQVFVSASVIITVALVIGLIRRFVIGG